MTWIRVETNVAENDKVIALAEGCGISAETALGFLVRFWGRVADHRPDGDLRGMSDDALERWAAWNGMPNVFASQLRKLFMANGILDGWMERQGKLAARAAADRRRKRRGSSADDPPLRNGTERSSSPQRARVREALPEEAREAFDNLDRASANPAAFAAELCAVADGMRPNLPTDWPTIGRALQDLSLNGKPPEAALLRAYIRRAGKGEAPAQSRQPSGANLVEGSDGVTRLVAG